MIFPFLMNLWPALQAHGYLLEALTHWTEAKRETLRAIATLVTGVRAASAPYVEKDPLAAVLYEVFGFLEKLTQAPPSAAPPAHTAEAGATKRRLVRELREALLKERASLDIRPAQSVMRRELIDELLRVLDRHMDGTDQSTDEGADSSTHSQQSHSKRKQ